MQTEKYTLPFCCPKCGGELVSDGRVAKCTLGHSFDKSKYGYYNFLLGSAGGIHGDNREMILARRAFLSSGYYSPLSEKMSAYALEYTRPSGLLVDVGCGEGYYTEAHERALASRDNLTRVAAFDISKEALRVASRRGGGISYAVASAYHTPFSDGSVSTVTNAFSPFAREEILRILEPHGFFIMAIPEMEHLFELKELLYKTPYKNEVKDPHIDGFKLVCDERLKYKMKLSCAEDVMALFKMTPYAYRTPKEAEERILTLQSLECTADFHTFVYRKDT
ncbi:MAG: methyltransferase domain-containing protein [Clostridia bacterium]|nr:methyltransferase domain-containing protein [Clostridia bacterium]